MGRNLVFHLWPVFHFAREGVLESVDVIGTALGGRIRYVAAKTEDVSVVASGPLSRFGLYLWLAILAALGRSHGNSVVAVNAPAVLLVDVTKRIATGGGGCPPPIGCGERAFVLLFFIGGLIIWFLVGLAVDNYRRPAMIDRWSTTAFKTLVRLFFVLCGVRLIFYGKSMISPEYAGQRHPSSTLIAGFIVLLWSFVLIVGPVRTFVSKRDSN